MRFVVEGALDGAPLLRNQSARERALDVFSQLRIWDTVHNNGVLIYLLLADHDFEIVADRGIDSRVGHAGWEKICQQIVNGFREGTPCEALSQAIRMMADILSVALPCQKGDVNELADELSIAED